MKTLLILALMAVTASLTAQHKKIWIEANDTKFHLEKELGKLFTVVPDSGTADLILKITERNTGLGVIKANAFVIERKSCHTRTFEVRGTATIYNGMSAAKECASKIRKQLQKSEK